MKMRKSTDRLAVPEGHTEFAYLSNGTPSH